MYIDFRHLVEFGGEFDLAEVIHLEYYKYERFLRKALVKFIFDLDPNFSKDMVFNLAFFNLAEVDT